MNYKDNALMKQLITWSLSDLFNAYNIDADNDIDEALNKLFKLIVKDIKESNDYVYKNN